MWASQSSSAGPLDGIRILELGGIGPGPFAGMMLADMGAEVIRVDRPGSGQDAYADWHRILLRGRRSLALDLKAPDAAAIVKQLATRCDALIEGFRPGVAERLGIGPIDIRAVNPTLVYGRMTGWGQSGPLAAAAGHDINYLAVSGALEPLLGPGGSPAPPLNMLGDFGGGGMLMAVGVLAGILEARSTHAGRIVDAAIVDGTALLAGMLQSMLATGHWGGGRGNNVFDGGAPFYRTYETSDARWIAVGALEPNFYANFVEGLGLGDELRGVAQHDSASWPSVREIVGRRVRERTLAQWLATFEGTDSCVSPVVPPQNVMTDSGAVGSRSYSMANGYPEPLPAPRFEGARLDSPAPAPTVGQHTRQVLQDAGFTRHKVQRLLDSGAIAAADGISA